MLLVCKGLTGGGAELSMLRLAENFLGRGFDVRIAVLKKKGSLLEMIPSGVEVDEIGWGRFGYLPRLARYLRQHRTDAIISFMTSTNVMVILGQFLSPSFRRVVVSEHNAYSRSIKIRRGTVKLTYMLAPLAYLWSRRVICVSRGVEDDLHQSMRLPRSLTTTVYNPVITEALLSSANQPPDHPWLREKTCPVLLAVGRLEPQKNYPLMLEAIARVRAQRPVRLIILGEGNQRGDIEKEIERLGLQDCVDLAGFRRDAMAFMHAADAFVLSSNWEGLSNVLIEALAVGCPVISTDAPHGPREVLQDGKWGHLVPVGDPAALTEAIEATLDDPGDPGPRTAWARGFSVDACAERYLEIAGLPPRAGSGSPDPVLAEGDYAAGFSHHRGL